MDRNNSFIECSGFYFIHNFDSGNLGHVEQVQTDLIAPSVNVKTNSPETPDYEFNLWTRPDCAGTEFENGNRTWFYFGIQAAEPNVLVRLNLINLNKQGKMYNQGMAPVTRTLPGKPQWERIRDRPVHSTDDNTFTLSFKYRTAENPKATTFFAFTYPYSYAELQIALNAIDEKMLPSPLQPAPDDIYYCRENLIYSLEGRRVDLLTISSHHGITTERETRLKNLFPDNKDRPFRFQNKKVVFISARVHPGETPSSFVFNGFLNLLLTKNDPIAIQLRKLYVFKMVPFLNPDGVARGHYRTDTRGVNLNRVYLNPSLTLHPSVYAARALIRYHHFGFEKEDEIIEDTLTSRSLTSINTENVDTKKKKGQSDSSKNDVYNKRFIKTTSKASGTPKSLSFNKDSKLVGEDTSLEEQVYDLKLQEMSAQTSDTNAQSVEPSLLDENVLRTCLGTNIHLSTSEELNFSGKNPLKPVRETLKNSISLLMESSTESNDSKPEGGSSVRMGWCRDCRSHMPVRSETPVYHTIEEYREHQRQQIDEQEGKVHDAARPPHGDNVYFCTNCYRRYIVTQPTETTEKPAKPSSAKMEPSSGSAGDSVDNAPESKSIKPATKIPKKKMAAITPRPRDVVKETEEDSGLFLYIDLHGHASKKGIFMYGNHFSDAERCVECMLLPRMMSLNSLHFHFSSCNFTERNMYLKDRRDGMSREGSGRVAVLKATGLVRSYTLECNYNTGRLVNALPPPVRDAPPPAPATPPAPPTPPKYTPHIFEEVGRSLGASILDVTGHHPNSRVPCSEHRSLAAVRDWLRAHARPRPPLTASRLRPKTTSPSRPPLFTRSKVATEERKENAYAGAKSDSERRRSPPVLAQRSGHEANNMKFAKRNEPVKTSARIRYLAENEPKPKTLSTKRKNILAIRKPNPTKAQIGGVKTKASRRSIDDDGPRTSAIPSKLSKRSFARSVRAGTRARPVPSSSSSEVGGWEEVAGGTVLGTADAASAPRRRPYPAHSPSRLKKIRLKNVL
ncbi:cytosolic carboxypeptidase-like protein 5 [Aricia agestis]|uniref:cytosolic carboxypeptidase-like protein 5 n=1 Tax=Aricia agestis TaxID=91739 RepID=UPI001C20280C|nr:cytosolic carboxypeptidase-like protein 5 [Aricia agestis]